MKPYIIHCLHLRVWDFSEADVASSIHGKVRRR
jgi:hypothetical protein